MGSTIKTLIFCTITIAMLFAMIGCSSSPTLPDKTIERFETQPDVASFPKNYTIAQLCAESELVVVGRVTDQRNVLYPLENDPDRCMGHATVKIEDVLYGDIDERKITVQDCWYVDEESGTEVTAWGAPLMRKGHRVLLFLKADPDWTDADGNVPYTAFYGELGKFFADEQGLFYPAVSLSESYQNGKVRMTLDHMNPRTLEDICKEIEVYRSAGAT